MDSGLNTSLFTNPPTIPAIASGALLYQLRAKQYNNRVKNIAWIFIEIVATLLVLGIIWINVDWVKLLVSAIAIALALVLFIILYNVL